MPELIPTTLTVTHDSQTFLFTIPTIYDEMRIGVRAREIRRIVGSGGDGSEAGLDSMTLYFNQACAVMDVLLKKASVVWPFTAGDAGPHVDSAKFPPDKINDILAIYNGYQEKLNTFRTGGNPDQPSDAPKTVAGSDDPGASEPVSS